MKTKNKNLRNSLKTLGIICVFITTVSCDLNAQQIKQNALYEMWYLETYVVEGKKYAPEKKEKDDFILFQEDMTFVSKSEGKEEEGTYIFNANGRYIEMLNDNGKKLKAYIISITKEILILKFDIKEIRDIEVHYNSHI